MLSWERRQKLTLNIKPNERRDENLKDDILQTYTSTTGELLQYYKDDISQA